MNKFIKATSVAIAVSLGAASAVTMTTLPAFAQIQTQAELDAVNAVLDQVPATGTVAQKQAALAAILRGVPNAAAARAAMSAAAGQRGMTVAQVQAAAVDASTGAGANTVVASVTDYVPPEATAGGPTTDGPTTPPGAGDDAAGVDDDAGAGNGGDGGTIEDPGASPT